jgi:hypothetical protein
VPFVQAHALLGRNDAGAPTIITVPTSTYQRRLLCLAFLAPDIQGAILTGRQPPGLTLNMSMPPPLLRTIIKRIDELPGLAGVCAGFEAGGWRYDQLAEHIVDVVA